MPPWTDEFRIGGGSISHDAEDEHVRPGQRLVPAFVHFRPDGYHADIRDPALQAGSTRLPTADHFAEMRAAYERTAPDPGNFDAFVATTSNAVGARPGWPDDALGAIAAPTLVVVGDHDFVRLEMVELIPDAQLAVLPGCTHMDVTLRTELPVPMLERFLPPS